MVSRIPAWTWDKLLRLVDRPRLGLRLALLSTLLASPALLLDFHLDDHIGRYIYSEREGAARLFHNYAGGYGLALGDAAENHWQMDRGWAPWWQYDRLLVRAFRPLGVLIHTIDFRYLLDSPVLMRAHSLLWAALLVLAVTRMYRAVFASAAIAGAAAVLFALDHTRGLAIGHICNRHALEATTIGALTLTAHFRYGRTRRWAHAWQGPALYAVGMFASELSMSVSAYVVAFELLAQRDAARVRAFAVAPYLAVTLAFVAFYAAAGYGVSGSGYYIDAAREPGPYLLAFVMRAPLLLMGQFAGPPAELALELPPALAYGLLAWALALAGLVGWTLRPVLRRDPTARFWAVGMVGCLVPAAGADPSNRQLVFASLGAMGLLAQAWEFYASSPRGTASGLPRGGHGLAGLLLSFRLVVSPLMFPLSTVSIALAAPINAQASQFATEPVGGRDVIFVTSPYEMAVRIAYLFRHLSGEPLPSSVRYLASGPQATTLRRTGPNTLEAAFEGGLLQSRYLHLHRDPRLKMPVGAVVKLSGFSVEVLATSQASGPTRVRFTFAKPLEDPSLAFYRWDERQFVPFTPPGVGQERTLPAALMPVGW